MRPFGIDRDVEVPVPAEGETWAVGAVILNDLGEAFAQKRGPEHPFPDCWDVVGGQVAPGEGLLDALAREIEEETGWQLRRVRRFLGVAVRRSDDGDGVRHEADFVVEVTGDLAHPAVEWSRHSTYAWFGPADLPLLKENRAPGECLVHDLISRALPRHGKGHGPWA